MLTFEEFSAKKKIDLSLFQQAEPALYSEFRSEYEQMGEKSFDHSKKFLFNKLRRAYHLKEEAKPAKTDIELTEIASQAEPLDSPTIEQKPAYTPSFKLKTPLKTQEDSLVPPDPAAEIHDAEKGAEEEKPKPVYQPRFKMKTTPVQHPQQENPKEEEASVPPEEKPEAKPLAYKPRFNIKNIKPKSEE